MSCEEDNKIKDKILGYAYTLEHELITEFKKMYPDVKMPLKEEKTERPTIDVNDYGNRPGIAFNTNSGRGSFFKAEPGFRPRLKVPPGKKIMPFIDIDGKIRYKYE
jgi:hypothetical protein